jgi:hypothetical protein
MSVSDVARGTARLATFAVLGAGIVTLGGVTAHADGDNDTVIPNNQRLNNGLAQSVYAIQRQAGCNTNIKINRTLNAAAARHAQDVLNNHALDGDIGSDGSTPQDRAVGAGYRGTVTETVAIMPSIAINDIDILGQWYYRPDYYAIMSNCANTQIGVWSLNSIDRSVLVAVYGQPAA